MGGAGTHSYQIGTNTRHITAITIRKETLTLSQSNVDNIAGAT